MVVRPGLRRPSPRAFNTLFRPPVTRRYVCLHAEYGLDARLLGALLEFPGGMHVPVVGYGQRRLLEFERPGDQVLDAVRAIEQGIFRVTVEMNEGHPLRIDTR